MSLVAVQGRAETRADVIAEASLGLDRWGDILKAVADRCFPLQPHLTRLISEPDGGIALHPIMGTEIRQPSRAILQSVSSHDPGALLCFDTDGSQAGARPIFGIVLSRWPSHLDALVVSVPEGRDVNREDHSRSFLQDIGTRLALGYEIAAGLSGEIDREALESAWDSFGYGVGLFCPRRRALALNVGAMLALSERRYFAPPTRAGQLKTATRLDDECLDQAFDKLLSGESTTESVRLSGYGQEGAMRLDLTSILDESGRPTPRLRVAFNRDREPLF